MSSISAVRGPSVPEGSIFSSCKQGVCNLAAKVGRLVSDFFRYIYFGIFKEKGYVVEAEPANIERNLASGLFQSMALTEYGLKKVAHNEEMSLEEFEGALGDGRACYDVNKESVYNLDRSGFIEMIKEQDDDLDGLFDLARLKTDEPLEQDGSIYSGDPFSLIQAFSKTAKAERGPLGAFVFAKTIGEDRVYQIFAQINERRTGCNLYLFDPNQTEFHRSPTWSKLLSAADLAEKLPLFSESFSLIPFVGKAPVQEKA